MANSLRDQLVAAGLASSSQAKKAEKQKKAEAAARRGRSSSTNKAGGKAGGKGKHSGTKTKQGTAAPGSPEAAAAEPSSKQRAKQVQAARTRRDKELARERNIKAQARAERAQIKQLIAQNDQRVKVKAETDVPYNFLHKKKIKRIHVPPAQLDALSTGKLVIVNNDGLYHLVTPEIAQKIADRDPKWIITAHGSKDTAEPEMDDYYKKFEVPDDLDW